MPEAWADSHHLSAMMIKVSDYLVMTACAGDQGCALRLSVA